LQSLYCLLRFPFLLPAKKRKTFTGDDLKWGPASPALPTGAQGAALVGDPSKEGFYVVRVKFPAGYKIAPHSHPNDENVTVISGMFHIGVGDKFDDTKGTALKPGGTRTTTRIDGVCARDRRIEVLAHQFKAGVPGIRLDGSALALVGVLVAPTLAAELVHR
jgi:hypothetical protein